MYLSTGDQRYTERGHSCLNYLDTAEGIEIVTYAKEVAFGDTPSGARYFEYEYLLDEPIRFLESDSGWVTGPRRTVAGNFCLIRPRMEQRPYDVQGTLLSIEPERLVLHSQEEGKPDQYQVSIMTKYHGWVKGYGETLWEAQKCAEERAAEVSL